MQYKCDDANHEEENKQTSQVFPADEHADAPYTWEEKPVKKGYKRPVIVHRAILGSIERCMAILIEHVGGRWPFFMSPR